MEMAHYLLFGLVGWVGICPPWPWPPWPWPIPIPPPPPPPWPWPFIRAAGIVLGLVGGYVFSQTLGMDLVVSTIGAYAFTRVATDLLGAARPMPER